MQLTSSRRAGLAALLLLAAGGTTLSSFVNDWPQWRGPRRDGISTETGLLQRWPAAGPALAWRVSGAGEGYSSFAVSGGTLYTLGARQNTEYVMAVDAASARSSGKRRTAAGSVTTAATAHAQRRPSMADGCTRSARAAT